MEPTKPSSFSFAGHYGNDTSHLRTVLAAESQVHAEVRSERGGPRLFVNGKETVPFFALGTSMLSTTEGFREMGIDLLHPIVGLRKGWTGPAQYDWPMLEEYLLSVLELHPSAFLFPRIQLDSPTWWKESHPEECVEYGVPYPERFYDYTRKAPLSMSEGGFYFGHSWDLWEASMASQVWQDDTAEMLEDFIRFIDASPLRNRMIGYFLAYGRTSEWNYFGPDYFPDYSKPMRRKCGPLPTVRERISSGFGLLRNPAEEADVIQFYRCYHDAVTDNIVRFAQVVKQTAGAGQLCGTFYGYLTESVRIQEAGYLDPMKVLNSRHIDIIACPYAYQNTNVEANERWQSEMVDAEGNLLGRARGVGGDGAFRSMVESLRRRGILFISEIDPSTYLDETDSWRGIGGSGSKTLEGSLKILRRDIGKVYARGVGGWLLDFGPLHGVDIGWYGSKPIIQEIEGLMELMKLRLDQNVASVSQVAVAADARSFTTTRHFVAEKPWLGYGIRFSDVFNHWFLNSQSRSILRMGSAVDWFHREDLDETVFGSYKLLFVPNTFYLDDDEIEELRNGLSGSGVSVVWYYAPGFLHADGFSTDRVRRLTGFDLDILYVPGLLRIQTAEEIEDVDPGFGVKGSKRYWPRFAVKQTADIEALGVWHDARSRVAFARKEMDGWTSIYLGTAPLPTGWLRKLARDSSVDLNSSEADVFEATEDSAMLVATSPGTRQVRLHKTMTCIETGLASQVHSLDCEFGDVRLFRA